MLLSLSSNDLSFQPFDICPQPLLSDSSITAYVKNNSKQILQIYLPFGSFFVAVLPMIYGSFFA